MSSSSMRAAGKSAAPWAAADAKADKAGVHHAVFWPSRNSKFLEAQRLGNRTTEPEYRVGAKYVGDWAGNKKSGFGVQTWTTGQRYEGGWARGKREGKGTMLVPAAGKGKKGALRKQYVGDWVDGKRHGVGVFYYDNGDCYEGEWAFGKRDGRGKLTCANGDVYEGGWLEDKQSGVGVLVLSNGDRFEGHWLDGQKEGPGRFYYLSTCKVYEGEWVGGVAKCGTFSDVDDAEFGGAGTAAAAAARASDDNFDLPSLTLADATRVMGDRVAALRQARAAATAGAGAGGGDVVFSDADLSQLREEFDLADAEATGTIECAQLGGVLTGLGMSPTDAEMQGLLEDLGAEPETPLSFAEFVDVMALLSSAAAQE